MKTIDEMIAVMTAYKEGKTIEFRHKEDDEEDWWEEIDHPKWDWVTFDYRVKSEPKYRPYANADECFRDVVKHCGWLKGMDLGTYGYHYVESVSDNGIETYVASPSFEEMLKIFVWANDGSPCGVLEE